MRSSCFQIVTAVAVVVLAANAGVGVDIREAAAGELGPPERIVAAIVDPEQRVLLAEVLERNPRLARLAAEARAAAQRAPQVSALPDPTASLTWFVMSPQTRVGPLRAAVNVSQSLPWFGSLDLAKQAALWEAAAVSARVEAARLELVTAARVAYHELQFLDAERRLTEADRATLERAAALSLARYAAGTGLGQAVIRAQAEITQAHSRLLGIAARRSEVAARLNALRDHGQALGVEAAPLAAPPLAALDPAELRLRARASRPEMAAATAEVEAAAARVERAKKAYGPEVMVGLSYGFVAPRDDAAGRLDPPEGNGDDDLGLMAGVSLPVWRSKLAAGVEEWTARRLAAEEAARELTASIDGELSELVYRIPLLAEQLRVHETVLLVQARQSLESAEAAYAAGTAAALDLLDAERVLLQVGTAAERVRADLAIAHARLEGAVGGPLEEGK